jgi:Family of unknown function (DUF6247)
MASPWLEADNPRTRRSRSSTTQSSDGDHPRPPRLTLRTRPGPVAPLAGYTAGMSAQAGPAGRVQPPGRTPAAVRAELPEALRAQFDADYHQALEDAKASYQLDRVHEVIQAWWQLAWARRSPTHEQALATGTRLLGGERVKTFPADADALRR